MIAVGNKVQVINSSRAVTANGEVIKVSTWKEVNGEPSTGRCYRVRCNEWKPPERWISAMFVRLQ